MYCKDSSRKLDYPNIKFTFLGYSFQPRKALSKQGKMFTSFLPAMSPSSRKMIGDKIRCWKIQRRTNKTIVEIANYINPITRGWINYYCNYYQSSFYVVQHQLDNILMRWSQEKYRKIGRSKRRAMKWLDQLKVCNPKLFEHWKLNY